MWLMPDMTTAPTAQIRMFPPHLHSSLSSKRHHDPLDWQHLFLPNDFSCAMNPYANGFSEYPDTSMNNTPSSVGFMSRSNNPSYGPDTNEWQPGYSLAYETAERQSRGFPVVPFPESSWTEPSVISRHGPAHYQDPFNDSVDFQLLPNQQQTPASITPSARAVTSPEFPTVSSLSPRTLTSVGTIQPARAITSSSHTELSKQYSHQQQLLFFRQALSLPSVGLTGPFVPQQMYKPHTNSDRKRYVEEIVLDAPIYFWMSDPEECGIPLTDALHSRVKRLQNRNCSVFEGRGPSVSIRLEWPGYRQWSRQIPTKDFRSPPAPITLAKLAKNIAKCVQRFIEERQHSRLEDITDSRWQVGLNGKGLITLDDIVLVSIHHVSLGSWQPHLRLKRPFDLPARG